jgi:indolepyruvate ferredoxin oxidoreductase alpha subunit
VAKLEDIFENVTGKKIVLLGNEALARGIVEVGVAGVFTYPGTPSSEIPGTLYAAQDILQKMGYDLYLEWSINEAVALESAYGFSFSGQRAIFVCKHVGLNVAADAFVTLVNAGVKGGLVLIVAEDPHMHSSQNEQDNRWYTKLTNVPMFEPSDAQESKDMLKDAFLLSEKFETPVILRTVTRIAHSRSDVVLNSITLPKYQDDISLEIDPKRFVCVPGNARKNKQRMLKLDREISSHLSESPWNRLEEGSDNECVFITCNSAYNYLKEVLISLKLDYPVLKVGISNPFPKKRVKQLLERFSTSRVIVVEEADAILEVFVKKVAFENKFKGEILGRDDGVTPPYGELTTRIIWNGLAKILKLKKYPPEIPQSGSELVFNRPPALCPGCPHRATFYALNRAIKKRHRVVSTDIGCYTLGAAPPLSVGNVVICMGSSIGIGSGISQITNHKDPVVAVIGDSTFWHTGLAGVANAVYNNSKLMILAVDNFATAMTGFQPNPGELISIDEAAKGLGVKYVAITDAFKPKEAINVMKEAIKHDGVSVVVSRGECRIQYVRREGLPKNTYSIDNDQCTGCHACVNLISCPAIMWSEQKNDRGKIIPVIDQVMCARCGLCAEVCPYDVIISTGVKEIRGI